jgi:transcriptional regulator with XRE-family HTH domain
MPLVEARAAIFAKRLKLTRQRQQLTQAQLAERGGLTPAAISQLEAGERLPAFMTIVTLAKTLGTTPNDLMGMEGHGLDPSLRELQGLFRDLKEMSPGDVEKVKAFAAYLLSQKGTKE